MLHQRQQHRVLLVVGIEVVKERLHILCGLFLRRPPKRTIKDIIQVRWVVRILIPRWFIFFFLTGSFLLPHSNFSVLIFTFRLQNRFLLSFGQLFKLLRVGFPLLIREVGVVEANILHAPMMLNDLLLDHEHTLVRQHHYLEPIIERGSHHQFQLLSKSLANHQQQ